MRRTRVVDPDVNHLRAMVMVSVRQGNVPLAEHYRSELADARIVAAARAVIADMSKLPPDKRKGVLRLLLAAAIPGKPS